MKIYFVGMPGSGKSTLGRQVAAALNMAFVDLDTQIEARAGLAIKDIFSMYGEEHFRQLESQLLKEWADAEKSFVMATGGGAPCFYNGIDVINQSGISIFLDVSVEELAKRVLSNQDRPLLLAADREDQVKRLTALHANRIAVYKMAKFILSDATVGSVMKLLPTKE
mgnify:CR=1 FL=1